MGICVIAPVGPTKIVLLLWHLCRKADFRVMRNEKGRTKKKSEKWTWAAARLQKVCCNLQNNVSLKEGFIWGTVNSRGESSSDANSIINYRQRGRCTWLLVGLQATSIIWHHFICWCFDGSKTRRGVFAPSSSELPSPAPRDNVCAANPWQVFQASVI